MLNEARLAKDIAKVQKNLENIKGDIKKARQKALFDTAIKFSDISEPYIPVVTGLLKSSKGYDAKVGEVTYSLNTTYAAKVEERRGYFTIPFQKNADNLQDFFEERFNSYFY